MAALLATEVGGVALVVAHSEPSTLWLPQLLRHDLADRVRRYLDAYENRRADVGAWHQGIDKITSWLWAAAMGHS